MNIINQIEKRLNALPDDHLEARLMKDDYGEEYWAIGCPMETTFNSFEAFATTFRNYNVQWESCDAYNEFICNAQTDMQILLDRITELEDELEKYRWENS